MTPTRPRNSLAPAAGRLVAGLAALLIAAAQAQVRSLPERPIPFERLRTAFSAVSVIAVGDRACHRLDTLLADTPSRRARGLMFVEAMPADAGMLFVYPRDATLSIWMKNTPLIPLDILFADAGGRIINIASGRPLTTDSMRSARPARYVLELNAGRASALGLVPGAVLIIGGEPDP
jgi:uncharacterized membrane protein (UPF0127 family)